MAKRGSIISSAKHIPGGARPTSAPQGGGPNFGSISPLARSLDTGSSGGGSWNNSYGGFLPRPTDAFTEGAFGPFSPILPVPVDAPPPGAERAEPRREEYRVGWNLPVGQPGTEGIKLADFSTLRTLADLYSVARACIQLRKSEIRGLEWDIMPTSDAAKRMRNDHDAMRDFGERREKAVKFFRRPDPDYFSWNSWIDAVLEEVFVFDALSILIRPKWLKGRGKGLLGSDLDSLNLISGPTIRPLYDINGGFPRPPAPAYQQYLYGVPRSDLMTMITQRDIEQAGLSGSELKQFRGDQMLYLPMVPRRWTPYGFPPIERALIPVMSGLQKQAYQLDYFREGTVPAVFVSPGGSNQNMTPNQIRELQDALNAIAGDPAWKHKIIVLPADSQVHPQKNAQIADQFDEIVMNQVCMAFDVQPMELGIMPKVSATVSPGAANQMSKATQDIQERKATKPILTFLADIMTSVLHNIAGQEDMRFVFEGLEAEDDEALKTELLVKQIGAGLRSIDEGREELNLQPWGLPETSDPGWSTPNGWVPLVEATEARLTDALTGPLMELPEGASRATQMLTGAAPQGMPPSQQAIGYVPPTAPGAADKPGKTPPEAGTAPSASAAGLKPRVNPAISRRPGAMGTGQSTAAATPGHSAAGGSKTPTKDDDKTKPAAKKPVASPGKAKAIESELDALSRHVRKGRMLSTWTPRHVSHSLLARIAEANVEGGDIGIAISVVKATRRVDIDGQTVWLDQDLNQMENAAGGGGRVFPAHDVDDTEVPGGTPGSTAGGEPPRWAPAEGTSSGDTRSQGTFAHHPEGGNDAAMPPGRSRPGSQGGGPSMPNVDVWPRVEGGPGGGRDQAGVSSPPGAVKGVFGGAPAAEVIAVMSKNFPGKAIKWVKDAKWTREIVPLHDVDFDGEASWAAHHNTAHVQEFVDKLNSGKRLKPAILVSVPGKHRLRIVDGHHRALAYRQLGKPIDAFVGAVPDGDDRWMVTHSSQLHQSADSLNKSKKVSQASVHYRKATDPTKRCDTCTMFRAPNGCTLVTGVIKPGDTCDRWYGGNATKSHEPPVAAGLTVMARDTGRILMLQRALVDDDPAAGHWEFPGGCLENGETGLMGAIREWQEETGCLLPPGRLAGTWTSADGVYQGFVYLVDAEAEVDWDGGRDEVINPDDPDGDYFEALAWWDPDQLTNNPAVRSELLRDVAEIQRLVREARGE